jgi:hypothetical protein
MNFLAHAAVARRIDPDPAVVLGAVLPDLLPMAGLSPRARPVEGLPGQPLVAGTTKGWALHHHVDEVFHSLPTFRLGVQALRVDLRTTALQTGPRRATAHVGWELLLDDALADDAPTVAAFHDALALAGALHHDPAWRDLLGRLTAIGPHPPSSADALAARVWRAVGRRPRLAFDARHLDDVATVLDRHRDAVTSSAFDVVDQVTEATARSLGA